jgi:hypothetical protein
MRKWAARRRPFSAPSVTKKTLARAVSLVVAVGLVAAGCSSGPEALPKVPKFKRAATTTTEVDYSAIGLRGVPGRTTTTAVPFGPGAATVSGVVVGEEGVIAGASVILERIVDGASSATTLITGPDGAWSMPSVLGGRYRARAFRQPDLAQTTASAVFLGQNETKQLELHVRTVGGLSVASSLAPDPPPIDRDSQLVVLVTQKTVDASGVVRATPVSSERVDLAGSFAWRVESANPTFTDPEGHATWLLRCRQVGRNPLAVTVGTQSIPLTVGSCFDPEAIETTTTSDVTETTEG